MNKTNEFNDLTKHEWISRYHQMASDEVISYQKTIIHWLFLVNAGGVAGLLTYIAAKSNPHWTLVVALIACFIGLASIMIYRTIMFYWLHGKFFELQTRITELASGHLNYEGFTLWLKSRSKFNKAAERCAWLSGIAAAFGGSVATIGIWLGS